MSQQQRSITADETLGGRKMRVEMSRGRFVGGCIIKALKNHSFRYTSTVCVKFIIFLKVQSAEIGGSKVVSNDKLFLHCLGIDMYFFKIKGTPSFKFNRTSFRIYLQQKLPLVNQISTSTCTGATTPGAAQQLPVHNGYQGPASIEDFGQLVPAC